MSQKQFSAKTRISVKQISAYENDRVVPRNENRRFIEDALDAAEEELRRKTSPSRSSAGGSAQIPEQDGVAAPVQESPGFDEVARIAAAHGLRVILAWTDERGAASAIAAAHDGTLFEIQTCVWLATLDDLRPLHARLDRLEERLRRRAR